MPSLHETHRKRVCRWAFFTLCLAPTLAVAAWVGSLYWPGGHAKQERFLSQQLHVNARLTPCETPKPGLVRTASLELAPIGSTQTFLELSNLELYRGSPSRLKAEQLRLTSAELHRLANQAKLWLANDCENFSAYFSKATVALGKNRASLELSDLRIQLQRTVDGVAQLQLAAQVSTGDQFTPLALTAVRKTDGTLLVTLDAERTELPACLLAHVQPLGSQLAQGSFRGAIQWRIFDGQVTGILRGRLQSLDFADLFATNSRFQTAGAATVEIEEFRFDQDRIQKIDGTLSVINGEVSREFLQQAQLHLSCEWVHPQTNSPRTPDVVGVTEAFDQLACRFLFDETGLTLAGNFPGDIGKLAAPLMVRDRQPLLMHPPKEQYPASHWVKFVAGDSPATLPATDAAVELARRLPARRDPPKVDALIESIEPATSRVFR